MFIAAVAAALMDIWRLPSVDSWRLHTGRSLYVQRGGMDKLRGALIGTLQDSDNEQLQQSTPTEVKLRNTVGRAKSSRKRCPRGEFMFIKFKGRQKWIVWFKVTYRGGTYNKKSRNEGHKCQDRGCFWGGV